MIMPRLWFSRMRAPQVSNGSNGNVTIQSLKLGKLLHHVGRCADAATEVGSCSLCAFHVVVQ